MSSQIEGADQVKRLLEGLGVWIQGESKQDISKASEDIAKQAREAIGRGQNTDGSPMAPLRKATLEGPIRLDGDGAPRSTYGATPMVATGKTAASITSKKVSLDQWEVSANTDKGDMILYSNAKQTHGGRPFGGDTPKVSRDPLQVADVHMDILETRLLEGIDRALNG